MIRSARIVFGIGALSVFSWLGACQGDSGGPSGVVEPEPEPTEDVDTVSVNASNALSGVSLASLSVTRPAFAEVAQLEGEEVAYISLRPGTVLDGVRVVISNPRLAGTLTAAVTDGGFDPVPVRAAEGDVVEIAVTTSTGEERRFSVRVPGKRAPKVVRTVPPRGKTGVPLNSNIVIVFTEPVAPASLTPTSVKVLRGTSEIAGTVRLLEGTTTAAVFEPAASLEANTVYKLVVTNAVTDLAGDSLSGRIARDFTTGSSLEGTVNFVRVRPDSLEVAVGDQFQLTATAFDLNGNSITGLPITWSSQDPSLVTVSAAGLVTGVANSGEVRVFATVGGQTGEAVIKVGSLVPIASVELSTDSAAIRVGGSQWLYVYLKDTDGNTFPYPRLTQWTSSNPAVATVADSGSRTAFVTGVSEGLARITVRVDGKSDTMTILVSNTATIGPSIIATTPANGATNVSRQTTVSVTFLDQIDVLTMGGPDNSSAFTVTGGSGVVSGQISTTSENFRKYIFTPSRPLASSTTYTARVTTAVRDLNGNPLREDYVWTFTTEAEQIFSDVAAISSVNFSTCALTTAGAAYCWGSGIFGDWYALPVAVGLEFRAISSGDTHTCGITVTGAAYCWGDNFGSRLGIGNAEPLYFTTPQRVANDPGFASLSANLSHTCALTATGTAYCWGRGYLGDGAFAERSVPVAVTGGLTFSMVSAGYYHTCGVTSAADGFCWGSNTGSLGDGTTEVRLAPVPVSGGLKLSKVSAGAGHTCGISTGGAAYCWGRNYLGQLGDGTTTDRLTPVLVSGGLSFASVSASISHTCGVTTGGSAYCWGGNDRGRLGDGTTTNRSEPTLVAGGLSFTAIATGFEHSCGVTTAGAAYCWGSNRTGQLGNASTTNSSVPVRVRR